MQASMFDSLILEPFSALNDENGSIEVYKRTDFTIHEINPMTTAPDN